MPKNSPLVIRIVINGCPSPNADKTREILLRAFRDSEKYQQNKAMFAITPGGFIQKKFPNNYDGERGWKSHPSNFRKLVPHAEKAVKKIVTTEVLSAARRCVDFLTVEVDLNYDEGKRKMDGKSRKTHAELIAIVKTDSGEILHWTGKSYPLEWQKNTLVHETDLKSHLFHCGEERVLVLGCHDLNMFSNRSYANQKPNGTKRERCDSMREFVKKFKPTVVLHHPHSTDSPRIWSTAWGGVREFLQQARTGGIHIPYASGIAYYNNSENPRGQLRDVREKTRCCDKHVLDVVVKGSSQVENLKRSELTLSK